MEKPTHLSIPLEPVAFPITLIPTVYVEEQPIALALLHRCLGAIERVNLTTLLPNDVGQKLVRYGFLECAVTYPWGNHTYTSGPRFTELLRVVNEAHTAYFQEETRATEYSGD